MELNINFDKSLEEIINTCPPLADWFERNQETMAYFELTHTGCLHFNESSTASDDIKVLGKMANAGLTYLESKLPISAEDKAKCAAISIADVYVEEQFRLSDNARTQYYLDVEALQREHTVEKSR